MDALILDANFETLAVLDAFESFIWTDRFCGYGDFEVYLPVSKAPDELFVIGNYLQTRASERLMIIENISIETNPELGDYMTVTGRSLESILERRVVWGQAVLDDTLQNAIQSLLNSNVISPTNTSRQIPNFIFSASTDSDITTLTVDTQFYGENLYDVIYTLCASNQIGFRVTPYGSGGFKFALYVGVDRSFNQDNVPWVIFSQNFENLLSSNYFKSLSAFKNAALVAGEGEGSERTIVECCSDSSAGLNRREVYVDASDISKTIYNEDGESVTIDDDDYEADLYEKGSENLSQTESIETFEGDVDATRQFIYGVDFSIGDVVQITNEYGMEARVRITEIVQSHDASGETMIPTFETFIEA